MSQRRGDHLRCRVETARGGIVVHEGSGAPPDSSQDETTVTAIIFMLPL